MATSTITTTNHQLLRRVLATLAVMMAALVLFATAAFAALRMGTDQGETITGTKQADEITGLGGNDVLRGHAGSDVYRFGDGFGEDTLEEAKKYGKRSGGSDLVDFSEVNDSEMRIGLVPEFDGHLSDGCMDAGPGDCSEAQAFAAADGSATGKVDFTQTTPERATGGTRNDIFVGGKENNLLNGGPGDDMLMDAGGMPAENLNGLPALAASNDTFIAGEDWDQIIDFAGKADKLDLTAMGNFNEVDVMTLPRPSGNGIDLVYIKPDKSAAVFVQGGVAPSEGQKNGVMEQVVFADGAKSADQVLERAQSSAQAQEVSTSSSARDSVSSSTKDRQQLAEQAKKLVEKAQVSLPLLGKEAAGK